MSQQTARRTVETLRALSNYEATHIAVDAYIYALPMVLMEYRRRVFTNVAASDGQGARGPMNQFTHQRAFPDASEREVMGSNHDTLYSTAWFDVRDEPLVISLPDAVGRYYHLSILDAWTDIFASLGTRTTGSEARAFVLVGPKWSGIVPDGLELIHAPTSFGWIVGQTRATVETYSEVNQFQDALEAVPLDRWHRSYWPMLGHVDRDVNMKRSPSAQVRALKAADFWKLVGRLWVTNPPHTNDYPILHRMERLGLRARRSIDVATMSTQVRNALTGAIPIAYERLDEAYGRMGFRCNGWRTRDFPAGTWGNSYLRRAAAAIRGIAASAPEDVMHVVGETDREGRPLDSAAQYVLHFDRDQLPPANAFWSLTMYDAEMCYAWNVIERYALGDRDALSFNADGSLDLYLQHTSPGDEKESNWLPTPPRGAFMPVLRLYWPKEQTLEGRWSPPALQRG
jgi:hypothetical protein